MATSRPLMRQKFLKLSYGQPDGRAKTSAARTRRGRASRENAADFSSSFLSLLDEIHLNGWCSKMSRACSARTKEPLLRELSTNSKRSGIWGSGLRATLEARACPTTGIAYSLLDLISPTLYTSSLLTAASCLGIIRRERRAGRGGKLDPTFRRSLFQTLRFWFSVAEASGTPRHRALAPRYVPRLDAIRAAIQTDQYYVARYLTWNECENLMGFPEGWTASEGDSLATL